jgi:hypothetical protein
MKVLFLLGHLCAAVSFFSSPAGGQAPHFVDVAPNAGLDFANVSGSAEKHYIIETQSAGGGFWDYDMDGHLDIFLTNGARLDQDVPPTSNALYRNQGNGTFADLTRKAGLSLGGWNMGCAMADADGDGDPDLYVTRWGPDAFYRNQGNGTFAEVAQQAGLGYPGWGIGAAFADYDLDGDLDLYVANYIKFTLHGPPYYDRWCTHNGIPAACGPAGFEAEPDFLYRNQGNGTFADVSRAAGIHQRHYYGMGAAWADLDNDGDPDLYVANDGQPNNLFRNEGNGTFADIALLSGTALSGDGRSQAGMGVALADYDNDGFCDIFVTNFAQDHNTLYRNEGNGFFADLSGRAGLASTSRPFMGWGTFFFDFDCDGHQDLFVANGHLMPAIERSGTGLRYRQRNQLFRNQGDGTFAELTDQAGPGLAIQEVSRGAAWGDWDDDGDPDVLVANLDAPPTLLRNDGDRGHWLVLQLRGAALNPEAIGARVRLWAGSLCQLRQVQSGSSFQAQNDLRLHFGLGVRPRADSLEIRWPSGRRQVFRQVAAGHQYLVREGHDQLIPD